MEAIVLVSQRAGLNEPAQAVSTHGAQNGDGGCDCCDSGYGGCDCESGGDCCDCG